MLTVHVKISIRDNIDYIFRDYACVEKEPKVSTPIFFYVYVTLNIPLE